MTLVPNSFYDMHHELHIERTFDEIIALANFLERNMIDFRWQLLSLHSAIFYFKKEVGKTIAIAYFQPQKLPDK